MDFSGFTSVDLCIRDEQTPSFVYVILSKDETGILIPLYVGQTKRIWGRMDDYYWASFGAATDFKVGESIRYLVANNHSLVVKYRPTQKPFEEERQIIERLREAGYRLLNDHEGYDYTSAVQEHEREKIWKCIDEILSSRRAIGE